MKLFDCFPFFNEVELLELRLAELYEFVDRFVIVEANKTHAGNAKEFMFERERERYLPFMDKIVYVKVDDLPDSSPAQPWIAENYQRNAIARGLDGLASPGDRIMVSDADEIPNIGTVLENLDYPHWTCFKQSLYYYYVNCRMARNWGGTVMAPYGSFSSPQQLRNCAIRHSFGITPRGGWHYSYLTGNDAERIIYKAQNIVDYYSGYNIGGPEEIKRKISTQTDLYNRKSAYVAMRIVDISNDQPKAMPDFVAKYPHFVFKGPSYD